MKTTPVQEMDVWPQRPDPDEDDFGLIKALVVGVPVGLLLWLGIWKGVSWLL